MALPDKQQKREARQLKDQARAMLERGDYRQARQICRKVMEIAPETDLAAEAARDLRNLAPDPLAIYVGLGSMALVALAWGGSCLL